MKESQRNEILTKTSRFTFKNASVMEKFNQQLSYITVEWYSKHQTDENAPISYKEMEQGVSEFIEHRISARLIDIFKDTYTEVPGRQLEYATISSSVEAMINKYRKELKAQHDQRIRDRQKTTRIPNLIEEPTFSSEHNGYEF